MTELTKTAIVYDWLDTQYGGAEWVIQTLMTAFPDADLVAAVADASCQWTKNRHVITTFLNRQAWIKNSRFLTALFSPMAFDALDLSQYDNIISVTSFAAKGVLTRPDQKHFSYILSQPRFAYRLKSSYLSQLPDWLQNIVAWLMQPITGYWQRYDLAANFRPDKLIPLSMRVKNQLAATTPLLIYDVCYPPIPPTPSFQKSTNPKLATQLYWLIVSRLVAYKNIPLAIEAAIELKQKLVIVGDGPDLSKLQLLAGQLGITKKENQDLQTFFTDNQNKLILFTKHISNRALAQVYQQAKGLIAIGEEDFGLTPLEAASYGVKSIINHQSGVAEVLTSPLADHLNEINIGDLMNLMMTFNNPASNAANLKKLAKKFNAEQFISYWKRLVNSATNV